MKLAIRVDASHDIGFGHLKRCLVLAKGKNVVFLTTTPEAIEGHPVIVLKGTAPEHIISACREADADRVLIDLKARVSKGYIEALKRSGLKTILLDNLGNGRLVADKVIYPCAHFERAKLEGIQGQIYAGWEFAIVDESYFGKKLEPKKPRILLSLGGSDAHGLTPTLIKWLAQLTQDFVCTVVLGPGFKSQQIACHNPRFQFERAPQSLAKFMLSSTLGIFMFGVTPYEAAAARLPSVLISQQGHAEEAQRLLAYGTCLDGGIAEHMDKHEFLKPVTRLLSDTGLRKQMQMKARKCLPQTRIFEIL